MDRRILLLGLLRMQEMHGYQLNDFIDRRLDFVTDLKKPTAYYILDKLCKDGYVREATEQAGNRPERKVYYITPEGEECFQTLLRQNLATFEQAYYADDLGLVFMHSLAPQEVRTALEKKVVQIKREIAQLEELPAHNGPNDPVRLVLKHKIAHLQVDLEWINSLSRMLADRETWDDEPTNGTIDECLQVGDISNYQVKEFVQSYTRNK
ncbi:MAG: PadR family transcriptional regulator [Chloroflexota bacterium]|nr:PadR family transcriptional regulator [Chloroflexota bacterium]